MKPSSSIASDSFDGTIHFIAPDAAAPSGDVRVMYRHAEILAAAGLDACIVHHQPGFRPTWFASGARVRHLPIDVRAGDVVVFPEIDGPDIAKAAPGIRKVILNQNAYYTFGGYPIDPPRPAPYEHPEIVATIVVSADSEEYLRFAFPRAAVYRVRLRIDPALYYREPKRRTIAFMTRKNFEDARQVLTLLRYRGALDGWEVVMIHDKSQAEAAAMMRSAAVFLSFGHPEGFGLPAAEAMACGCVVAGYHGNGGREYFTADHGFPVAVGDIVEYATTVERLLHKLSEDPRTFDDLTRRASDFVRNAYSSEHEIRSVLGTWKSIFTLG